MPLILPSSLQSPAAYVSPESAVCVRLLVKLMSDYLNELTYPAELAGLGYSVSNHLAGFQVRVLCCMYVPCGVVRGEGGVIPVCMWGRDEEGLGSGKGCIAGIPHTTVGDDATWRACACVELVHVVSCSVKAAKVEHCQCDDDAPVVRGVSRAQLRFRMSACLDHPTSSAAAAAGL
jgi:hypothetical protein